MCLALFDLQKSEPPPAPLSVAQILPAGASSVPHFHPISHYLASCQPLSLPALLFSRLPASNPRFLIESCRKRSTNSSLIFSEMELRKTLDVYLNRFDEKVDYTKLNPEDKAIFDSVKNTTLATLTRSVLDISVEGEDNWQKFKRTFVVFVEKCFLLPTMVSVASPIHKPPIFHVDNIREWDWAKHVLNFLMKGIENKRKGTKQSVDECVFVLMLIYFHETKFPCSFGPDAPPAPWVTHWTKQMMLDRILKEATDPLGHLYRKKIKKEKAKTKKLDKKEKGKKEKRKLLIWILLRKKKDFPNLIKHHQQRE
ncbi:hypothetical protein Ahy_A06g027226 [Arachis hypogaea]|uniref:Uncharacterized protein n=1 Tax=Arachis hypogaea TaxID=3818 RepID=A0A445CMY4_ARAHY|nr:hypothetical protein Ahy_A06g027226 [Arachis hypogaea]